MMAFMQNRGDSHKQKAKVKQHTTTSSRGNNMSEAPLPAEERTLKISMHEVTNNAEFLVFLIRMHFLIYLFHKQEG